MSLASLNSLFGCHLRQPGNITGQYGTVVAAHECSATACRSGTQSEIGVPGFPKSFAACTAAGCDVSGTTSVAVGGRYCGFHAGPNPLVKLKT